MAKRVSSSQRQEFIQSLIRTTQKNKQLRASTRPILTMIDVGSGAANVSDRSFNAMRIGRPNAGVMTDFVTGTGNVLDRILRYKEYDLMAQTDPLCKSALDCWADNTCIPDPQTKNVVTVESSDEDLKEEAENFLYGVLEVNHNLRNHVRKMCQKGDHILVFNIDYFGEGVVEFVEARMQEIDRRDEVDPTTMMVNPRYYWKLGGIGTTTASGMSPVYGSTLYDQQNTKTIETVEMIHFCLDEETDFQPFGKSKLEAARYAWKQLRLMEDAMLTYRVVRAPERRIFRIEVGNLQDEQMRKYVDDVMAELRREPIVDPSTGDINLSYNVSNALEDFVFPQRQGHSSSIEQLPGGQNTDAINDVEYFRKKVANTLGIPIQILEFDSSNISARNFAKDDARFAASIGFLQHIIIKQLRKAVVIHLLAKGKENGWTVERVENFNLKMTNASAQDEIERMNLLEQKINSYNNAVGSIDNPGPMTREFALRYVMNFDDTQIAMIKAERLRDAREQYIFGQINQNGNFNKIFPETEEEIMNGGKANMQGGDFGGSFGGGGGGFPGGGGMNDFSGGENDFETDLGFDDGGGEFDDLTNDVTIGQGEGSEITSGTPAGGAASQGEQTPGVQTAGFDVSQRFRDRQQMVTNEFVTPPHIRATDGIVESVTQKKKNLITDVMKVMRKLNRKA